MSLKGPNKNILKLKVVENGHSLNCPCQIGKSGVKSSINTSAAAAVLVKAKVLHPKYSKHLKKDAQKKNLGR